MSEHSKSIIEAGVSAEEKAALVVNDRRHHALERPAQAPLARTTPADLLQMAVGQGADLDRLEKLMALQDRWEKGEARKTFTRAMAAFKTECPPVLNKDGEVSFKGTNYRHATLGGILSVITPHLSRAGLSVSWETDQDKGVVTVTCVVTHEDGHSERRPLTGPHDSSGNKNQIQQMGSTITYLQRYTLTAALGLSTGEVDDDGRGPARQRVEPGAYEGRYGDDPPPASTGPAPGQQPPTRAQRPQEPAQPTEALEPWVTSYLARLKTLGVLRSDLESGAGRGLGVPASRWSQDKHQPLLDAIGKAVKAVPPGKRPALVRDLFCLEPGAEG